MHPAARRAAGGSRAPFDWSQWPPWSSSWPSRCLPSVVEGLLYGDPTEGVSLVDVPKPDNVGEAYTSIPVDL